MSKMIRVGECKPAIKFIDGFNDMSHYFPSGWITSDYFYISFNEYNKYLNNSMNKYYEMDWYFVSAVNKNLDSYVHAGLGEPKLVKWSWFDAFIKLPTLQIIVKVLNRLRRHKVIKEKEEWDRFLEEVR